MPVTTISYKQGMQFEAKNRDHLTLTDLSVEKKGQNQGPTPPELFVSGLGSCIGVYLAMYCQQHQISCEGLTVKLSWEPIEKPTRIGPIDVDIKFGQPVPADKKQVLLNVARSCLIHNTLVHPPQVLMKID